MKVTTYTTTGTKDGEIELPVIFSTPFRRELIHKACTNLTSHKFQPQGRHPSAGQDVVADSNDPPTGQGVSRVARAQGGGGGRQGQGAEVASTRGGRQAHPPIVGKVIYKKLNKKENKLALCSAIAATASKELVKLRGHKVEGIESFPIVVSDEIEGVSKASEISKILDSLKLTQDTTRLEARKSRSGQSRLRGRSKKVGKSVLFVTKNGSEISKAIGALPGIEVKNVKDLSVLDLAPGSHPIRLTVYSKSAIEEIAKDKINTSRINGEDTMNVEQAMKIIVKPYITEKTFAMIENENKICFIVELSAKKPEIAEAVTTLYKQKAIKVNTARTIYGKKAFVQFESTEKARDLATKIGML